MRQFLKIFLKENKKMINNIVLTGRLTTQPELKTTTNGISVLSFSIAVERNYSSGGERQTDFINCVAYRGTAEFISRYFSKGEMIALTGSLQMRKYETQQGEKRTVYEVVINEVSFCGSKSTAPTSESQETTPSFEKVDTDDDLLF